MSEKSIPLVVVAGPTAAGKTRLAVELAIAFDGEVVSADSMQIYRGMDIGTAKPTEEEKKGVPHHMMDILEPEESYSVARYLEEARRVIGEITARGRLPILCGGTGLYISSLVDNIRLSPASGDPALRAELELAGREKGGAALLEELSGFDPETAAALHPNNRGRIIRAIEIYRLTGIPISVHRVLSRMETSPYRLCMLGLSCDNRETLYRRINSRVDDMIAVGLVEEVRRLRRRPLSDTAAQAIGYKEVFAYLDGQYTLEQASENLKQATRRYAKRQLTWFRRDKRYHWLQPGVATGFDAVFDAAVRLLEKSGLM